MTTDELRRMREAEVRYTNPKPTEAYPWPCDMHEQPAQRVADMATLGRAYLALADACRRLLAAERESAACEGLSPGSFGAYLEIRQRLHDARADIGRLVGGEGEG